jgi:hypothetical protein
VASPQDSFHTYSIDWTKDYVKWSIDGNLVRTLNYADAKDGTRFPQTPMQIKLGTWVAGGKDSPEGTVQWAGGYTDFTQAPFLAYYQSITIQDASTGATSYNWKAGSDGSYGSINVITDGSGSTSSATPSSTATGGSTSTKSGDDSSKTTLSTATTTVAGGLTLATNGVDVANNGTSSATGTGTGTGTGSSASASGSGSGSSSSASKTSSASGSATTTPAATNGAFKAGIEWTNAAVLGAGVFLGFLVM